MPFTLDRTNEFFSIFEDRLKEQQLQPTPPKPTPSRPASTSTRAEFYSRASKITQEIHTTAETLDKLAKLAKKIKPFNDHSQEITNLTLIIKERLASHNQQLDSLSADMASKHNAQADKYGSQVVSDIKSRLMSATQEFKTLLQKRTESIRTTEERKQMYFSKGSSRDKKSTSTLLPLTQSSSGTPALFSSPHSSPPMSQPNTPPKGDGQRSPMVFNMNNMMNGNASSSDSQQLQPYNNNNSQQKQLMMEKQDRDLYIDARSEAVREIETTVVELSSMFQKLSAMVAEQGEMIRRIDDDVEDARENVEDGASQVARLWSRTMSNRGLILKIFLVLVVFVMFFGVFVLK